MRWILLSLLSVTLLACASAPTQEMSDARQAVQAAHDAGADDHAPDTMHSADQQLDRAGESIEARDYREARRDAVAAKDHAFNALDIAHAIGAAKEVVDEAAAKGMLSLEAARLLEQANRAARDSDVQKAIRLANEARHQAAQDLRLTPP